MVMPVAARLMETVNRFTPGIGQKSSLALKTKFVQDAIGVT
jgi:hypothetical protein